MSDTDEHWIPEIESRPVQSVVAYGGLITGFLIGLYLLSLGPISLILPLLENQGYPHIKKLMDPLHTAYRPWFAAYHAAPEWLQTLADNYGASWISLYPTS